MDDTTWLELIEAFGALIPRFDDVGLSKVSSILKKRSKMLQNEVVLLMKYLKTPSFVIDFDLIKGWLSLMKVDDEFKKHYASVQFSSNAPTLSFRLSSFENTIVKNISVSEATVERLFSRHKRIHLPLRACLSPDI